MCPCFDEVEEEEEEEEEEELSCRVYNTFYKVRCFKIM
jgi:hypothetical protein